MGFIGMIIAPLCLLFLAGVACLIGAACVKARRKRLVIAGCVLCAPLAAFVLVMAGAVVLG